MPQAVAFAPPPHSVAVLPFTNIGGTAANDYVSDGLSEEVIGTLGQLNQLRVASRTSSFGFRTGNLPIETIARRLNVATVLEGSIRWASTHLRVNAQLIDGRTGYQIWSKSYDREQGDVLHLETEIATEISKAMQVNLGQDDIARLDAVSTGNKQALDAYLRGIMLKRTLDPSKANETLAAFDQAVALDPNFIMARVLRARVLTQMAEGFGDATKDVRVARNYAEQAIAEAEQALSLDPNYAPAHDVLAVAAQLLWDFPRAASEFARARDLAGNDPAILRHYVTLQVYLGHADAMLAESRHAVALDPLSLQAHLELLHNLLWTHHADEAEAELHYAAQLNLSPAMLAFYRGRVAIARGDGATARAACQAASGYRKPYCLALAEHLLGHQADSEQQLAKFRAMYGDVGATLYANIYAQWGQKREALDWLETAYRSHDPGLQMLNIDPLLDPLRGEPGFVDLVRKMKFPA
jgi:serine/threonine-protein kinase